MGFNKYLNSVFLKGLCYAAGLTKAIIYLLVVCISIIQLPAFILIERAAAFTVSFTPGDYNGFGVSCNGSADGFIDMTITGGTFPFDIIWSNGDTTEDINGLVADNYVVTIIDAIQDTVIDSVMITEPATMDLVFNTVTDISCNGLTDGAIDITASGGTNTFSYLWTGGSNDEDLTNLAAGNYSVIVTDNNSCTVFGDTVLTEPDVVEIVFNSVTDITCNGLTDGAIDITASGGTNTFTYLWTGGSTDEDLVNLAAGSYSVSVTDNNSCSAFGDTVITEPSLVEIVFNSVTDISCNGLTDGAIDITATGGTNNFTYLWTGGSTDEDLINLAAGNYSVTATDNNSCSAIGDTVITEPSLVEIAFNSVTDISCNGLADGAIDITASGGTNTFTYLWTGGSTDEDQINLAAGSYSVTATDNNSCSAVGDTVIAEPSLVEIAFNSVTDITCHGLTDGAIDIDASGGTNTFTYLWTGGSTNEDLTNLAAGSYSVTVSDNNSCSAVGDTVITEPSLVEVEFDTVIDITCNGLADGAIDITASGGTNTFTYLWTGGITTEDRSNLAAGNYSVTVTDDNSCTAFADTVIIEPALVQVNFNSVTDISCNGLTDGAIDITALGGTNIFTYLWTGGITIEDLTNLAAGNYSVIVTDLNDCSVIANAIINEPNAIDPDIATVDANGAANGEASTSPSGGTGNFTYLWSTGATDSVITGLLPGTYTVTITDDNNCSVTENAIVNNALGGCAIAIDSVFNVTCNGLNNGAIYISTPGAIPTIIYQWSHGAITQDVTGLAPGPYTVTITDITLCTATQSFTITEPAPLVVSLTPSPETCAANNGGITSSFTGGTGTMGYLWSNSAVTANISGLNTGTYTVTITDQNGCTDVESALVSQITPPQVTIDSILKVSCFGGATGAIYTTITNGSIPYSIIWSNSSITEDITGLIAGTYTVTVTDADLCTATTSGIVVQPSAALNDSVQTTRPTCGLSNGSITIFPYAGTGPYTYLWSNAQTTQTISSLAPGTYTVTITDASLCTRQRTSTITNIAGPVAVLDSVRAVRCFTGATGGVFISTTGGTAPITYLWSNSAITQDISNVVAGTYTVTVTDANLCTSIVSGIVTQPLAALNDSVQTVRPTCGLSNGSITVFPYAGTSPYTYLWNNSQTTQTISSLAPGTYTVTITDANLCTRLRTSTITNIAGPVAILDSVRAVRCFSGATGGVFIHTTGGTAPITYLWSNSAVTQDISNVVAGTYTVTVTDANLCTSTVSGIVTQPLAALNDSVQTTRPTCGLSNGSITEFPYSGTSPYTYLWSNSQTTQTISSLAPGTYTVTITDANLCTRQRSSTITNIAGPVVALDSVRAVRCFSGATGGVFISVTGGTAPITYLWSNSAITQDISNVVAGIYTVTVTDANLCTSTVSGIVTQPLAALNDSVQTTLPTCGVSNGSITVFPYSGTSPYTYLWNNSQTTQTISSLAPGTYTVTITDANLCTRQRTATLINLGGPSVVLDSVRAVRCFGGATGGVFVSVTGGTAPITYLWSNSAVTQDISNVIAGTYTVTVTDANLCTATVSGIVTQPLAALNDSVQTTRPTCGLSNGSITVFPYAGTSPYTYLWNNSQTTQTISSLAPGTYTVTITDANLCTRQRSSTITNIAGPVVALDSVRVVRCFGGATGGVFISVTGGTAPITYLWSNSAITQDISNVIAGTYTVTVTDANLCTSTVSGIVTQPLAALNDSVQTTLPTCGVSNGSITVFPFSGTSPYTYLWNNSQTTQTISSLAPGTYTVTITDANLCTRQRSATLTNLGGPSVVLDSVRAVRCFGGATGGVFVSVTGGTAPITYLWSNSALTQDISNVVAGTYTVTVTDANLCTATVSGIVTQPLAALNDSVQTTRPTCGLSNGSITVFPYAGTSPYTYLWNNSQTTQTISALAPGTYTVTITDANLCTRQRSSTITNIAGPVAILDSVRAVSCFGGATGGVFIHTTGGTAPITYLWSNSAVTQDISNVIAGTYTVTVTDANLCTSTVSGIVTQPLAALNDSVQTTLPSCGVSNGSITVFPFAGTSPYTYLWNNSQTTQTISSLAPGSYTVTITDANLCTRQRTTTLINLGGPSVVLDSVRAVRCFGGATGGVFVSVTGGTSPITYLWSNSAVTQDISNVIAGTYTVTVTDANLCTATVSGIVTQPVAALNDSVQTTRPSCGLSNGSITVFPYAGTSPYTYLWNNSQTTQTISSLAPGTYTVTITDANLCTRQRISTITNIAGVVAVLDSVRPVRCFGGATGGVFIHTTGGGAPITYLWSNSAVTQDIQNVIAGTYTVTVTDGNLCTSTVSGVVTQPATAISDSVQVTIATCGTANGSITIFPFGGTPGYTYLWSNLQSTQTISNLASGVYSVTITDANLCTRFRTINVSNAGAPVLTFDSLHNVSCFGGSNAGIFITVSGGTLPYNYLWSNSAITQDINNVPAGSYTVTVSDFNNCQVIFDTTVTQPLAALNDSVQTTMSTCGLNNGSITVFPYAGTSPYTYLWSNAQTTQTISSLAPGTYTVTITDANLCTRQRTSIITNSVGPVAVLDSVRAVRCFGGATGGVFIHITGGTAPITYLWSNGTATQDILNVIAGTYTVTVTDGNLCTSTVSGIVTQPLAALNDSVQTIRPSCGLNNGSISVFPYAGTSPYTYLWNNSQTTQTISSLAPGTYTVTITDANLCTRLRTSTITNIAGVVAVLDSVRAVRCFGGATGGVFIHVMGGTAPITYQWSNSAITQDIQNVIAGTYTVTVTDSNLCVSTLSGIVTQPLAALNDSINVTNAACGNPSGSATVFPYGGTAPHTLLWSTGSVAATIFNLNAGSYTVTITDAVGCTRQDVANVSSSGGPVVTIDSIRNVKCFGGLTGGVFISLSGGANPFGYVWSTGANTQDLTGVGAGTYTVTVTDDNNCVVIVSGTIVQPTQLQDSTTTVNALCGSATGSVTTYPYGGVFPYTYLWNNGQFTQTISGLNAGIYTVTVTDFNGCTVVRSDTVLVINGPLAVVDSVIDINCFNQNTGAIYTTSTGGTGTLSYLWSNAAVTPDLIGVGAGTYTLTVTDQNNCSVSVSATINQQAALLDSAVVTPEACNSQNGAIDLFPYGGTPPYSYLWSNGEFTQDISGLQAGTFTVTVTDSLGCTNITPYVVNAVGGPQIALDSIVNVKCNGGSTGGIYISINGGTSPITYNWSNSVFTEDNLNIPAATYTIIVTDLFLCADTAVYNVAEPTLIQDSLNTNPATCNLPNGSAKIYPYGGMPNYTYLWSNGQVSQTAVNLAAGTYTVTVTDQNLCTLIETAVITDIPIHVITLDSLFDASCFGLSDGSIYISVNGGEQPYDYLWSNTAITEDIQGLAAGIYTVTVTDNNNCAISQPFTINQPAVLDDSTEVLNSTCGQSNGAATIYVFGGTPFYSYLWNTGAFTPSISNVPSGPYTVTVTDFNGCTLIENINIADVGGPVIQLDSIIDVTCNGDNDGAIYVTILSGTSPYIYSWSNFANTADITGLIAGSYTLTVTDQNNCQQFATYIVNEPAMLQDSATIIPSTCGGTNGSITVFPYGGTGTPTFLWNSGAVTATVSGLAAGTYTVTITDSNSCTKISQYVVNNFGGPSIAVDSLVQIKCFGDSTGAIYLEVTDGLQPYVYAWSNFALTEDILNIPAGTYTITVTDQNNCTATVTNVITQPTEVEAEFTITPSNCNSSNGAVATLVTGGIPTYSYLWNTNAVTPDINGLAAGVYTLTVTDQNLCVNVFNAAVNNLSAPEITVVDSGNVTCFGMDDGFITVEVNGGFMPYNYSWTNTLQTGNQLTNLPGNVTYTLTITDSLGCITIRPVFIAEPAAFAVNSIVPQLNDTFNLTCFGSNDGSIHVFVTGGTMPYTYLWSNFAFTDSIGSLSAGNYTVTITDFNGCTTSQSFTLTQPPLLVSNAGPNKVICGVNSDTLAADPPAFGDGYWMVVSGSGTFDDSTQYNTPVTDLTNGVNVYQWVVTDGICSSISQVVITFNTQISAIAGIDKDICTDSVYLTATAPDFGFGYWQVVSSTGDITDSSKAVTLVTGLNPGPNVFRWVVINGTCSDSSNITIFVNDPSDCIETIELPTGFTPNGDGRNDFFIVKGLDDYPENSIEVFNRWGNLVYERSGYANEWDGNNDNGEPLIEGTYFVIIKVRTINKIITSYVDLRR